MSSFSKVSEARNARRARSADRHPQEKVNIAKKTSIISFSASGLIDYIIYFQFDGTRRVGS